MIDEENNVDDIELVEDASQEQEIVEKEEDEKEAYSKRVQKRIDKLAYERNIERDKREALERKVLEQDERIKALAEAQEERNKDKENQEKQDLLEQRKAYLEIGDYDEINKIDEQLIDLKIKPKQVQKPEPVQQEQPKPYLPDAMKTWYQNNQWVYDTNQKSKLDKADAIYADLVSKGYDPEDDELYQEVDKRLKREIPPPGNGPDRGQVMGNDKSGFTKQDRVMMEGFGLDPENPIHRKEWIKQKSMSNG